MKRTVLIVPVAFCVSGSAVAQDRSGQTVGSGSKVTNVGEPFGSADARGCA
jgi:hypothetical protein